MASVVNKTEAQSSVGLVESNSSTISGIELGSGSSQEQRNASPVQIRDPSLGSQGVADNVVLSAVQEDLEVGKVILGEQVGIVDGIAGADVNEEIIVNICDAVLVGDVGVNTVGLFTFRGCEPVVIWY